MKYVMPIEDKKMVAVIGDYLREKNERDYVLFMTGIYLGRRINDILNYRVKAMLMSSLLKPYKLIHRTHFPILQLIMDGRSQMTLLLMVQ